MFSTITQTITMTIIPIYMNVKNLLLNAIEWLRRRVAALRDTRGVYVNDNDNVDDDDDRDDNDDGNVVGATFNSQFSIFNSKNDSSLLRAEEYIMEHYDVRYNRLSREHELCERGNAGATWYALNDELCCTLLMEMQHAGIGLNKPYLVRTVVRGHKGIPLYHPVCSYLDALPQWDGRDHIDALFRRITSDEQQLLWLRRWLLGMVAQVQGRLGRYGNSVCPLIISRKQGWGKSQFAKLIVPPQLQMFYTDTFNLAQEDTCLRRMAS